MIAFILVILSSVSIHAKESPKQKVVYASCLCEVFTEDGVPLSFPILPGLPVPTEKSPMEVTGVGTLNSSYEQNNCQQEGDDLSMACSVGAIRAQRNATFLCGQLAQSHYPDDIRGFEKGNITPSHCYLSIGEEEQNSQP